MLFLCTDRTEAYRSCTQSKVLPNKNQIRERNRKVLDAAILTTWFKRERSTNAFLAYLFRKFHVQIENASDSSSTLDLTPGTHDVPLCSMTQRTVPLSIYRILDEHDEQRSTVDSGSNTEQCSRTNNSPQTKLDPNVHGNMPDLHTTELRC